MYVLCTDGLTTWAMGSSTALQPDGEMDISSTSSCLSITIIFSSFYKSSHVVQRLLLCCFKHYALRTDGLGTWAMVSPYLPSCPIGEEMDKLYSTSPYLPNKISADKL